MNPRLRLRHYFTHHQSLGGVQSIIDAHLRLDPTKGLEASLLALFDRPSDHSLESQVEGLGLTGRQTIHGARQRFQKHEASVDYDIPVFHDLWGLAFLGEFDQRPLRRIGAVHSQWPHLNYQLSQLKGSLDGIFCDSQAIADYVLSCLPDLCPKRVRHLPVPSKIAPEHFLKRRTSQQHRPVVLGFVGRLDYAQKRVDRFPALLKHLQEKGIDCEMQFLGSGDASESLPDKFPKNSPVHFFGRKSGSEYWEIMSKWDYVIYTSDHEGSPLAMIESMSVGNIPIFPRIGSGGDLIIKEIDPNLLYEQENWGSISSLIKDWQDRDDDSIHAIRKKCREISLTHSPESYHEQFMALLNDIVEMPRISGDFASPRPRSLSDHVPFGLLNRWIPKGFFHANPLTKSSGSPIQK
jgi:glycosyltransferase involved in cell wall biosynthesis